MARMAKASKTEAWESKIPDTLEPLFKNGRQRWKRLPRGKATLHAIGSDIASYSCTIGYGALAKVVKVLIDSGASHSFLSTQLADQLRDYRTPRSRKPLDVGVANGESLTTKGHLQLPIAFGDWTAKVGVYALDLPYHDMILGRDWLKTANPQIDWETSEMRLSAKDKRHIHVVRPIDIRNHLSSVGVSLDLMSAKQAARILRKKGKERAVLAVIRPLQDSKATTKDKVEAITKEFAAIFREELPPTLPPERGLTHHIDTGDEPPVNQPFYPLSQQKLEELKRQLTGLLEKGIIKVSSSPWGFPVVFAPKSDGSWRMCIDYRLLNQKTKKNGYPLPRIQDLIDQVGGAKYLSKIDLLSGYWQIRMDEASIQKTAFNTLFGKYEFLAMPFGLSNAPATFQTLMNQILSPYLGRFCFVYLDDILIFSNTWEEHEHHLRTVLETLEQNELFVKGSKCVFGAEELEFCGHIVGRGTVRPVPAKLEVIDGWPQPKNIHDLRQFLGLATYYRRFVRDFAKIAAPLHELLKEKDAAERKRKYRSVLWNAGCEHAFRQLKRALVTAPVLSIIKPRERFRIETDASEWAIGMVLSQPAEDGKWHPVAFDGRKLNGAERNYPTQEKELLAIKEALRSWEYHLENGTTTEVLTDHETLKYLATTRIYSKRLVRWIEEFQAYDLNIKYRPGKEAVVPDAISRRPDFVETGPTNVGDATDEAMVEQWLRKAAGRLVSMESRQVETWEDSLLRYLTKGYLPFDASLAKRIETDGRHFAYGKCRDTTDPSAENTVFHIDKDGSEAPYLQEGLRSSFVKRMHESYGHLGYPGLLGAIGTRAWWPSMRQDIQAALHECPACQVSQRSQTGLEREQQSHMFQADVEPFERWGLDLIGPLPATPNGNRWIITAIDYATGWPVAKAVSNATDEAVARFLHEDIFTQYGAMSELVSDNGPNILSKVVAHYVQILKVKHRVTTPHHPRTNGRVERLNGVLGSMLTKMLVGKPTRLWDEYLPQAILATRIRVHSVANVSPFELVYGIKPRLPDDQTGDERAMQEDRLTQIQHARALANERLLAHAIKRRAIRDDLVKEHPFEKDDWVLVRNETPQKFQPKWFGPYRVLKRHPLGTYAIEEPDGRVVRNLVNGQRLIRANVDKPERLWSSTRLASKLKRVGLTLHHPIEVRHIVDAVEPALPSYSDLSTWTKREWEQQERTGVRSSLVGEEEAVRKLNQRDARKARKPRTRKTQPQEETAARLTETRNSVRRVRESEGEEDWIPEEDSPISDDDDAVGRSESPQRNLRPRRDAGQADFDGPFAVVIPSRQERSG